MFSNLTHVRQIHAYRSCTIVVLPRLVRTFSVVVALALTILMCSVTGHNALQSDVPTTI